MVSLYQFFYMKNTAQKDIENSLDTPLEYKENPEMEVLWTKTFQDEYKPDVIIDFKKIKDFLIKNNKEDTYRKMRDYNYNIINPMILCDMFIKNPNKKLNISFLESLPDNIKRCLADLLLEILSFTHIQKELWTAMLFWIWHHCYVYSNKRNEKLKEFLINSTSFIWSEKNYNLLEKSRMSQRQLHRNWFNIRSTLLLFEIAKHLPEDITDWQIDEYLKKTLWKNFSLSPLYARQEYTKGKAEERYRKDIDNSGNTIDPDSIYKTSTYIDHPKKSRYLKIPNRQNPDIYKDRSWMTYKIYLDGPMGIGLFHDNKPIAIISFSLWDKDIFFIHQIQSVIAEHYDRYGRMTHKNVNPLVHTIPRQKTLYDIVVLLAKKYGCKKIVIQSWENNEWLNKNRQELQYNEKEERLKEVEIDKPHLSLDIAKQIYDVFAKKQWFKKNKKTKNRDKEI